MTRIHRRIAVVAAGLVLAVTATTVGAGVLPGAAADAHEAHDVTSPSATRIDPVEFRQDMRKLWEDHITWTRLFIVSAVAGLDDVGPTADRLLQNQADIGDAVATFYGADAGAALTALLRDHILIAGELVSAAASGDTAAVADASDRWYANADDIAEFLAGANPAWPVETLREMMRMHLDQTLAEATARIHGDWAADIADYDAIHHHILEMADTLAAGIIEQFPRRFDRH